MFESFSFKAFNWWFFNLITQFMDGFLPPATKLGQGYIFTGVCDSVHKEGCLPQCMLGCHHTPWADTPQSRHHPPGADPPRVHRPPEQTPSRSRHHLEQTPPRADTPPAQSMLGDTVNARAVRILLECNLVCQIYLSCAVRKHMSSGTVTA